MSFETFKKFAECGLRIAKDLAVANGVAPAQADLWILRITAK